MAWNDRLDRWLPGGPLRDQIDIGFRLLATVLAIAALIGLIAAWTEAGFLFLLLLLGLPFAAMIALIGAIVLIGSTIRDFTTYETVAQRIGALFAGPLVVITAALLFSPTLGAAGRLGDLSRLAVNHARYEAIIAQALHEGKTEWFAERGGITYSVDVGPPLRVAFNPSGMLNNWSAIVFDPTGKVTLADGFDEDGNFSAPARITKLFGGDLVSCRSLWGDYYKCSFT